jgi:hypothetical protein
MRGLDGKGVATFRVICENARIIGRNLLMRPLILVLFTSEALRVLSRWLGPSGSSANLKQVKVGESSPPASLTPHARGLGGVTHLGVRRTWGVTWGVWADPEAARAFLGLPWLFPSHDKKAAVREAQLCIGSQERQSTTMPAGSTLALRQWGSPSFDM